MKREEAVPDYQADIEAMVKEGICYMCGSGCPIEVHVQQGKAIHTENADPRMDICPRWRAQLDFVYHPERLQYPLKRVGERGSGAMVRVSWDEALHKIASKLLLTAEEYGPESVVFYTTSNKECLPYYHRLTHAFGSPNFCTMGPEGVKIMEANGQPSVIPAITNDASKLPESLKKYVE